MAPNCAVTVYHLSADQTLVCDSLTLPVRPIDNVELSLRLNYEPDKCASQIELIAKMAVDSTICISAVDDRHPVQGHNLLSRTRALTETGKETNRLDRQFAPKRAVFRDDLSREHFVKDYPASHRCLDSFEPFHVRSHVNIWLYLIIV